MNRLTQWRNQMRAAWALFWHSEHTPEHLAHIRRHVRVGAIKARALAHLLYCDETREDWREVAMLAKRWATGSARGVLFTELIVARLNQACPWPATRWDDRLTRQAARAWIAWYEHRNETQVAVMAHA